MGTGTVGKTGIVGRLGRVGRHGRTGLTVRSGGEGDEVDDGGENDGGGGCGFIVARISGGSGVDVEKFGSSLICFNGVMDSCSGGCRSGGWPERERIYISMEH